MIITTAKNISFQSMLSGLEDWHNNFKCIWWFVTIKYCLSKNDFRYVFTSECFYECSCFIYVICIYLFIMVYNTYCVVFLMFFFVLCTLCWQFLWIFQFYLPLRYSPTYITRIAGVFRGTPIFALLTCTIERLKLKLVKFEVRFQ